MRILLILKRFDFGGAENHVCDLANSLCILGHDVFLVAGKGRQVSRLNSKVTFVPFRLRDIFFPINLIFIYFLAKKYRIDIIHAHQRIAISHACFVKKLSKIPLVVTVHGRTRLDLKSRFTQSAPDRIIFVSNYVLQISACYNQIKDRSFVIPNGVNVLEEITDKEPYSISYVSRLDSKHSKVILMIIREVLPKLMINIPQLTFTVIGEGKGLAQVKKEAISLNNRLNRKVCNVIGFQPEIQKILQKSSLVLGVGRVSLEALAYGASVLSVNYNRLGGIISTSNYDDYKVNNFVAIGNGAPKPDIVYSIIKDFYTNLDFWQNEIKSIQGLIKRDFSILPLTQKVVDVYNDAIIAKTIK